MAVDPTDGKQVGAALQAYLTERLAAPRLRFVEPPETIGLGWETHIYAFRLAGDGLSPEWDRPLILRMYPGDRGPERAHQEDAVQRFVIERDFPAPRPLLIEPDAAPLGLPFMIMERVEGRMLVDAMSGRPMRFGGLLLRMVELHVRLHQVDTDGFPLPSEGTLVERQLALMREVAGKLGIDELDGLAWLESHKQLVIPEERRICHNDFHPLNIVIDRDDKVSLIDWSAATLGDRHCDIATTLVVLRTFEGRNLFEKIFSGLARWMIASGYQRRYRRRLPIDRGRLRYWEALRSYQWWLFLTALRSFGGDFVGVKSDTLDRVPPKLLERMQRYFRRCSKGRLRSR